MGLLQLAPIVIFASLICIEAIVLATHPQSRFPRWFPGLLVGVAAFGLLFSISALLGHLVISPEIGLLMMEGGKLAYWSIVVITLSCAISLGLLVPVVGRAVDRPVSVAWAISGSAIVAWFTYIDIRTLNPTDSPDAWISAYDLWSPPLVLWLTVSLIASALRAAWIVRRGPRLCCHAFAITIVALAAMNRFEFLDPRTKTIWEWVGLVALTLSVGCLPIWLRFFTQDADTSTGRVNRAVAWITSILSAALIAAWFLLPQYRITGGLTVLILAAAILFWKLRWIRHLQSGPASADPLPPRPREVLMLVALVIMAMSLLFVHRFSHTLVTIGLFTAWVVLAESTSEGALSRLPDMLRAASPGSGIPLWRLALASFFRSVASISRTVAGQVRDVFGAGTVAGVILKTLIAIIILIALSEVPNARTTIVGNFTVEPEATQKGLGQAVGNQLVFALHSLNEQLRPDVALLTSGGGPTRDKGFKFVAAMDDTSTSDTALAKGGDIDLGPLKMPLTHLRYRASEGGGH